MKIPKDASAVVTGAGSGFGRAIAKELGARGAHVIASDLDEATAQETAEAIRSAGGNAEAMRADVRRDSDVKALVDRAVERFGRIDVLVNNAGVAVVGPVGEVSLEDWRFEIDVNLLGVIHGCHFAVPEMKRANRGWILNVASAAGLISAPMMGPYNVTKAGVVALSETMRGELDGSGVNVSVLCPTFFRTNIHKSQRSPEKLRASSAKLVENAKWSAEEVARVALRGLERGTLYVIPQTDGKVMWRAKRALGASFYAIAGKVARRTIAGGS
jgi:hypothetical protein